MNKKPTLYEILGVAKSTSKDEIKAAYKKLALKYHPDKNPDNPAYEEHFKKVNEAYQTLSDDKSKAVYDSKLRYAQSAIRQRYRPSYRKDIHLSGLKQTIIITAFVSIVILGSILLNNVMNNFSA
ncbi:MAG: DnaJ domain-containing protein, partial [Bacteroidetes bacterium]|nr:DnaJ domain-containing protein [Bacteroidota bacterium]